MKKIVIFAAAMAVGIGSLAAQGGGYLGALPYFSGFWLERMHGLGGQSAGLGTTRSAAMGGAFTSLGADLSSMHINPAGLGMYRTSEFGITFGPSIGEVTNSMNKQASVKDSRTAFALNNFGAAFNLFEGSKGLTSFTMGIGYQRLADYNYRSRMNINIPSDATDGYWSILGVWASQMTEYAKRIGYDNLSSSDLDWFGTSGNAARLYEYGAAMAASNPALLSPALDGEHNYQGYFTPGDVLSANARTSMTHDLLSKGSQGEYVLSGGWNFENKFYFGVTLGIVDIYQDRTSSYGESYEDNTAGAPLQKIRYIQRMRTAGDGFNAKFGVIWRPDPALRVGVAFHTPTVVSMRNKFSTSLDALYANGDSPYIDVNEQEYQEKYYTPARLMAGISGTIAGRAILSADWEQTYYNGMNVWGGLYDQTVKDIYRDAVKQYFTAANTVRVGAEVMAGDMLFLRAGWQWSDHGVRKTARDGSQMAPFNSPVCYNSNIASVGFGVKIGANASFDMTYSLGNYKYTGYNLYYISDDNGTQNTGDDVFYFPGASHNDFIHPKLTRHNIMLGLNFRF